MSDARLATELRERFFHVDRPAELIAIVALRRATPGAEQAFETSVTTIAFDDALGAPLEMGGDVLDALRGAFTQPEPERGSVESLEDAVDFGQRVAPKVRVVVSEVAQLFNALKGRKG